MGGRNWLDFIVGMELDLIYRHAWVRQGPGGLVYTSSGADKKKVYYLKRKRTFMSIPGSPPISIATSGGNLSYP